MLPMVSTLPIPPSTVMSAGIPRNVNNNPAQSEQTDSGTRFYGKKVLFMVIVLLRLFLLRSSIAIKRGQSSV